MRADITAMKTDDVRETVREKYAERAREVAVASDSGCGPSCCRTDTFDPVTSNLYASDEIALLPGAAVQASQFVNTKQNFSTNTVRAGASSRSAIIALNAGRRGSAGRVCPRCWNRRGTRAQYE